MIIVLFPVIAIIIAILFCILKKPYSLVKKICLIILVLNLSIISFIRSIHYGVINILFLIIFLINVLFIILLINSKIKLSDKIAIILLIICFIVMIALPVYKFEDHEHVFENVNNYNDVDVDIDVDENITGNEIDSMMSNAEKYLYMGIEKIYEYTDYSNCYGIRIKRIYKNQ